MQAVRGAYAGFLQGLDGENDKRGRFDPTDAVRVQAMLAQEDEVVFWPPGKIRGRRVEGQFLL